MRRAGKPAYGVQRANFHQKMKMMNLQYFCIFMYIWWRWTKSKWDVTLVSSSGLIVKSIVADIYHLLWLQWFVKISWPLQTKNIL